MTMVTGRGSTAAAEGPASVRRSPRWFLAVVLVTLLSLSALVKPVDAAAKKKKRRKPQLNMAHWNRVCTNHTLSERRDASNLATLVSISGDQLMAHKTSPQNNAGCWLMKQDPAKLNGSSKRFEQRYALATLYHATLGHTKWKIKDKWLSGKHECQWYGVVCNGWGTVIGLDLGFNDLYGLLPRELALLQSIEEVDVHGNDLQGVLPPGIMQSWTKCKILRLHMNGFFGNLPSEIGFMKNLGKCALCMRTCVSDESDEPQKMFDSFQLIGRRGSHPL